MNDIVTEVIAVCIKTSIYDIIKTKNEVKFHGYFQNHRNAPQQWIFAV